MRYFRLRATSGRGMARFFGGAPRVLRKRHSGHQNSCAKFRDFAAAHYAFFNPSPKRACGCELYHIVMGGLVSCRDMGRNG